MNKIDARNYTLNELLEKQKYYIDDYQREYRWEKRQIEELLSDLWLKFSEFYEEGTPYSNVKNYGAYFLGSILISFKDNEKFIVDGQQRLTSLSLLIIYFRNFFNSIKFNPEAEKLSSLIYSDDYGNKSFNIQVDDRELCMESLFNNNWSEYIPQIENISAINMIERYKNIEDFFLSVGLNELNAFHFIYWLKFNVYLVKITTSSDDDAYTIFETMNDRGLNLDSTEMLKGYLIANLPVDKRNKCNDLWKKQIASLKELSKEEDSTFFKNWLRAKYAITSRTKNISVSGYTSEDFERIGNAYHKWVKEKRVDIGLIKDADFLKFIEQDFLKFSELNLKIKNLESSLDKDFVEIYCNDSQGFTLQTMLIFATINMNDNDATINQKIKIISKFIDIFIARYIVNSKVLGYSGVVYKIFNYVKIIRENSNSLENLKNCLKNILEGLDFDLSGILDLKLNKQNKNKIHYIIARITNYLDISIGNTTIIDSYLNYSEGKSFEVEHIIPDKRSYYGDDFLSDDDFQNTRSKIGNLSLLQNGTNQSIGNSSFDKKKVVYKGNNILLRSLCEETYINNPNFINFIKRENLNIKPYSTFSKNEVDERTDFYYEIAKKIWDPN
ncbi:MAG: DUF262 domain-containing protein, partial [Cetobacterium sp.]